MTRHELRTRLEELGYITQMQMAAALYGSTQADRQQANVSRYLSGARPVPAWVPRTLTLLEKNPPVLLSGEMRLALEGAAGPGDEVPVPESDEPHVKRVEWTRVYEAMERMGAIRFEDGIARITEAGWAALFDTDLHKERIQATKGRP